MEKAFNRPLYLGNKLANNINISDIKCDYILITHGHQDHLLDAELIGNNNNTIIISNYEIVSWYNPRGLMGTV